MLETRFSKILPLLIIPIAVYSILRFSTLPLGNTVIWWGINGFILFVFFWETRYGLISLEDKKEIRILKYYLLWNVFSIIYGAFFMAETYWDYKSLVSMGMTLLVPLFAYIALNERKLQLILSSYVRYALPFSILIFPFSGVGAWGWYLFPISFLLLFLPILSFKSKLLVVIITLVVIIGGISVRSYLFKFGLPIILLLVYHFRSFPQIVKIMNFFRRIILFAPILLFVLAVSGIFNVFNMSEYMGDDVSFGKTKASYNGNEYESKITDDSRTFLYVEVLSSAIKYDYWILGRSPARGNETEWFADETAEDTGRSERIINEVGILNVFTWTGVIGVVLIFLVFYKATYLAINQSSNIFIKMIGLFVVSRWLYFWVEDYQMFDLNSIVIWMMVGLCFSKSFRGMSNEEVKLWAKGIFSKNHLIAYKSYVQEYKLEY